MCSCACICVYYHTETNSRTLFYSQTGCSFVGNFANFCCSVGILIDKLNSVVANCSEQVVNQNTSVAVEVCKVARKRTSGLTVIM